MSPMISTQSHFFKTQRNVVDNSYHDSQSQLTAVGSVRESVSIDDDDDDKDDLLKKDLDNKL